jgi:hypothetical protein
MKPLTAIPDILRSSAHNIHTPNQVPHTVPFQNFNYRARVRVVDYFPHDLRDFSVSRKVTEYDLISDMNGSDVESDESGPEDFTEGLTEWAKRRVWEWRFYLLVEDLAAKPRHPSNKERMKLLVAGPDAEHLLGIDAVNLRADADALHELREKLFILWGGLEEKKSAKAKVLKEQSPNNRMSKTRQRKGKPAPPTAEVAKWDTGAKAFDCCIKEYGIQNDDGDWQRCFAMFMTKIL